MFIITLTVMIAADNGDHGNDPHFAASSPKVTAKPRPGNRSWHLLQVTTFRIAAQAFGARLSTLAARVWFCSVTLAGRGLRGCRCQGYVCAEVCRS